MASQPLRFIHASDFHLGRAMRGLVEPPEHLRDVLIDSTYAAATRVFDAACEQRVDFVVLAGDIFSVEESGPRGYVFLSEQFERLQQLGIAVYWCGGRMEAVDGDQPTPKWPENLTVFSKDHVETIPYQKHGAPAARIVGLSYRSKRRLPLDQFVAQRDLPTIAVAYDRLDADALQNSSVSYWALGSEHKACTLFASPAAAHYCGAPQALSAADAGSHGCTLVELNLGSPPRLVTITTDVVLWHREHVVIEPTTSREYLENILRERAASLANKARTHLLVSWTVAGGADAVDELRSGIGSDEIMQTLRDEFGRLSPALWSVDLQVEYDDKFAASWRDEQTVLGDYLRVVREREVDDTPLDLTQFLSERHAGGDFAAAMRIADARQKQRVLKKAGQLGVELLRGEEPKS